MIKNISIILLAIVISLGAIAQDKTDGIKYYRYEKYQSAIKTLEPLATEDATANYYLGLSYLGLEDIVKAKKTFQKHASSYANMSGIARVLFMENKVTEAKAMLENVIRKTSRKNKSAYLYAADAITYTDGGDLNKSLQWYDYYLEWKKTARALIHKGDALRKMQRGGEAMTAYQEAGEMGSYTSLSSYKQGNLWYASKTFDSALVNYQRAVDADPENPLPYYDLSMAYYKINKYDRAKEKIEEYLKRSDKAPDDLMQYANILYLSKDYDGAITKMNELLKSGNGKSYMYRVLGYSYLEKKGIPDALKNMDLLFQKHPKDKIISRDYFMYGKILAQDSLRKGEAMSYFEKGIAADTAKDKTSLYRELAESFKDANDWANAAIWYKKITQTNSPNKEILDYWWAGRSFYQVSDYINATDMFTQMTVERPEEPSGFYWLGKVGAAQDPDGSKGIGVEPFKKYVEMVQSDTSKKAQIVTALTYLSVSSFNNKRYAEAKTYANQVMTLDPGNGTAKQILAGIPK